MVRESGSEPVGQFRFEADAWLWCLHCRRFFQGRDALPDRAGGVQGCAFPECSGAGSWIDIYPWNGEPPIEELQKGLHRDGFPCGTSRPRGPGRMGDQLNRDAAERDRILGISMSEDPNDVTHFSGLDLTRLALLVAKGFIDPDGCHHLAPSAIECMTFLMRFPEICLMGYVVHPAREDYRMLLEGFHCDLTTVSPARRAVLKEEFVIWQCDADVDEYMNSDDWLCAWWD